MVVQFRRWGNSLAVRIPSSALKDIGVGEGASADLRIEDGNLILSPIAKRKRRSMEELVKHITEEQLHDEIDFGPPVGSEIW